MYNERKEVEFYSKNQYRSLTLHVYKIINRRRFIEAQPSILFAGMYVPNESDNTRDRYDTE